MCQLTYPTVGLVLIEPGFNCSHLQRAIDSVGVKCSGFVDQRLEAEGVFPVLPCLTTKSSELVLKTLGSQHNSRGVAALKKSPPCWSSLPWKLQNSASLSPIDQAQRNGCGWKHGNLLKHPSKPFKRNKTWRNRRVATIPKKTLLAGKHARNERGTRLVLTHSQTPHNQTKRHKAAVLLIS